ncbi:MAG TPA: hypothetical protein VFY92_02350 [Hyphomicrobiaceae bacterium]|nr:hypothetical protein [Hyphomicrobiaceae bacterium]
MSRLDDIEKNIASDIARLTAEAKFSAWLDQLEGRLQATGLIPAPGSRAGRLDVTPAGRATRRPGGRSVGAVTTVPAEVISFRRDPRRFKQRSGV